MSDAAPFAAQLLETSAAGYASAAQALLRGTPDLGSNLAGDSIEWKTHLRQRILELATAIRVGRPELFARRIGWLRRAIKARGADDRAMRAVLESLRITLDRELPEQVKATVEPPLRLAIDSLDQDLEPEPQSLDPTTPRGKLGLQYLAACLEAKPDKARQLILDALDSGLTPQEAYTDVLLPAQREIGQLWHTGDVSVSEERLVSESTRELMTLIVNRFAAEPDARLTLLAASVEGNAHDIGLRAAADLFRIAGWRVVFLGADMPSDEIVQAAQSFEPRLVALSATLTTQISALAEAIDRIKRLERAPPVLVGGLALKDSDELWRELGADAYAPDVASALDIGSKLISPH